MRDRPRRADAAPRRNARRWQRTWGTPQRAAGAGSRRVDHKSIGRRYIVTAFVFFVLAGVLGAGDARCSWPRPENGLVGPDRYNQLFTMHGTTMMFLFAVPVMEAFAVYLVPLMVGHAQRSRSRG